MYHPQYFRKFQCTGSLCKHNCCHHNWNILIDRGTYNKYAALGDDFGKEVCDNIRVLSDTPFKALMQRGQDGKCKLLNEKGLCSIQLKLGYEFLSRTCRLFPRKYTLVEGEAEASLELSCEVTAKLILFDESIMRFEESEQPPTDGDEMVFSQALDAGKYTSASNANAIFWKLRTASIVIMQSRQYRLRLRLLILCLLMQQIDELFSSGRDDEVIGQVDSFLSKLEADEYDLLREQMPYGADPDPDVVLGILKDMKKLDHSVFNRYVEQALKGLGIPYESREIPAGFMAEYFRLYNLYFVDKEHIFENYIINTIFSEGFPFNYQHDSSVLKNYAALLAKHDIIEFLLTGVCRCHMKFDKRKIIECVTFFARVYDHSIKGYLSME